MKSSRRVPTMVTSPVSIRMASSGQASTQKPQKTQRRRSISKTRGRFSFHGASASSAMMWMQLAGQAVGQHMQATHFGVPSSRAIRRWRLRWRAASGFGSSGNWTVGISPWRMMFRSRWPIVTRRPRAISGR